MSEQAQQMQSYLAQWPGKSARDGGVEHPAVYHMLDVAAVAECLMQPFALPAAWRDAMILLVALHDLGKVGDGFRNMLRHGSRQGLRHWELTEVWLFEDAALRRRLGADPAVWRSLVAAIAGHHGGPSRQSEAFFSRYRRQAGADAARDVPAIVADLAALWPEASLTGLGLAAAEQLSWWLSGLTVAADWVGSNPDWFPARMPSPGLAAYLGLARQQAMHAVALAGLKPAPLRNLPLFDFALRPMQEAARDIVLPEGPMLAFIEDETGAGKTEAALLLAQRMLAAGKGRGLYFALPTMATADAMFARAEKIMGRLFEAPSLTLAHGRAQFSERFRDLQGRPSLSDDITCAPWLADNRRRALLADIGIGTVDQALLAVLPTRFSTLRLWGLSSKLLLVDEAHEIAGNRYMNELLAALLQAHARQGGSAILLTATLPIQQRAALARAFAQGAGCDWPEDTSRDYPALSIAGGAACRAFTKLAAEKGDIRVERLADAGSAVDVLAASAAQGAACLWVRNAVDEAIAAVALLHQRGVPATLLHARFALCDRKRIEAAELARFGKAGSGRAGRVLVATQVVEASLDLDFDVMVSDLAPAAALIQRAGRLWRHMAERPRNTRAVAAPVLHVLAPDPAAVSDARWLMNVLGRGAWVYPLAEQWRSAEVLFRTGIIAAPGGVRDLVEACHSETIPVPEILAAAELERIGEGYAEANQAIQNLVDFSRGYRDGGAAEDDTRYPTRLGPPTRTLVLAQKRDGGVIPWANGQGRNTQEDWMLSEVQADQRRLERLQLPDQAAPLIAEVTNDWPEWRRQTVLLCIVDDNGAITEGLHYDPASGLLFE